MCVIGRISDHEQQKGPFVVRAAEHAAEEAHRAGGVGQRGQPGMMQRGDKKTGGNADRLLHVVVLDRAAIGRDAMTLRKDGDQIRRGFEKGLVGNVTLYGPVLWWRIDGSGSQSSI